MFKDNSIDIDKLNYIKKLSFDKDKYTYNKNKKLKSTLDVYDHFVKWYLKYGEIDRLYFINGNDTVGANKKYYPTRLCVSIRNKFNSYNGSDNYRVLLDDKVLFNELCNLWNIDTIDIFATSHQGKI